MQMALIEEYKTTKGKVFAIYASTELVPSSGDGDSLFFKAVSKENPQRICKGNIGISRTLQGTLMPNDPKKDKLKKIIKGIGNLHVKCALEAKTNSNSINCETTFLSGDFEPSYDSAIKSLEADLKREQNKNLMN